MSKPHMSALKFGITAGGDAASVAEVAQRVEALGFDSIWEGEHVMWHTPVHDVLMLLATMAAVTRRVRLGTSILLLPLKHPLLVCKAVTTLDHASQGRVSLGIGIGGEFPREFEAMGIPMPERAARAHESLELMKRLWTEDHVTFHGRFFSVHDISLDPKPVQKPHPPILVGGRRRAALSRAARYGDGWMPYLYTPEMYREDWKRIEELAAEAGRDPASIERTLFIFITMDKSYEAAAKSAAARLGARHGQNAEGYVRRYVILGTPQQCAEQMDRFREVGVDHFILCPGAPADQAWAYRESIAREIIPLLRREG